MYDTLNYLPNTLNQSGALCSQTRSEVRNTKLTASIVQDLGAIHVALAQTVELSYPSSAGCV